VGGGGPFLCLLAGVAAGACGGTPALVVAPVEPALVPGRAAAPADGGAPDGAAICHRVLRVGPVTPTPSTCWIDERVGKKTAPLTYPCAGGAAAADFGTRFEGTADSSGNLRLEATTTFHWSGDGCTWQSTQRIGGNLGAGELVYAYEERPVEGSGCAPAKCTARAAVRVTGEPEDGGATP
jgi:hypothetical protein